MSDHSEAPVAPVEAFEPPYCVSVFTAARTQDQSGHSETAARMDALTEWRTDAEHRAAQKRGQVDRFESHSLHIAKVERSQGFVRA